jgi:hypothetical protein
MVRIARPRIYFVGFLLALVWLSAHSAVALGGTRQAVSPLPTSNYSTHLACAPPGPERASCLALELVPETPAARAHSRPLGMTRIAQAEAGKTVEVCSAPTAAKGCYGLRPQDLHDGYGLPTTAPPTQTIALIDAYNDPSAEEDLRVYDDEFGLPSCTTANGCFTQVNEQGRTSPLPKENVGWAVEISLDIEVAHAICQTCHIVLVEADNETYSSLDAAEETAASRLGATEISNSWAGREPLTDNAAFDHPGIAITAAAGDHGYRNWDVQYGDEADFVGYPASSPHVIAVGGTRLSMTEGARTAETVWNDGSNINGRNGAGGGGCSEEFAAPSWQLALSNWLAVGCGSFRAVTDVSADADPYTGAAIYDSIPIEGRSGWRAVGGTSLASPLIASVFALAGGANGVEYPAKTLYENVRANPDSLYDITSGSNGECAKEFDETTGLSGCSAFEEAELSCAGAAICLAGDAYDGPSGVGTPDGINGFKPASEGTRAIQRIEFTSSAPGAATAGGAAYTVSAKASSGLPVSFSSGTPSVCLVADSIVHLTAAGTCTINANQVGDSEYLAAPQVQQSFVIGKGSQRITFITSPPGSATVGQLASYEVAAVATSGLTVTFRSATPSVCEVWYVTETGADIRFNAAGTCTIGALQGGNENFEEASEVQQSFAVSVGEQVIEWISEVPRAATLKGPVYEVEATASSRLPVSFSSATPSVCSVGTLIEGYRAIVTYSAAGTCTIDANQVGNSEYPPARESQQSFTVSKRTQRIEFISNAPTSATLDGAGYVVSVAASSGLSVSMSSTTPTICTLAETTVSFIGVGTCTLDANQVGNDEFEPALEAQQSFSVGGRSQSIEFTSSAPATAVLGGADYIVSAATSSGLAVSLSSGSPSVCSVTGSSVSFVGAGLCTVEANQGGDTEYSPALQAQQSFAVAKRSQLIALTSTAPSQANVGGASYTVSAAATSGLEVLFSSQTPSACLVTDESVRFVGAGTCTIDADQPGNAEYGAAPEAKQSFTVASAPLPAYLPVTTSVLTQGLTTTLMPTPDNSFDLSQHPTVNSRTGAINFTVSIGNPGTLSWLLTFRSAKLVFGEAHMTVPAAGSASFTVSPSAAARQALKNTLKQHRGLSVTATLTFRSSLGGSPVSHEQSVTVTLKPTASKREK